jgi:hypothetical protein
MTAATANRRWAWFLAWSAPGACLATGISQIGVFTIPAGLLLALVLSRVAGGNEALGLLEGVGAVGLVIGLINLDYRPCPTSETITLAPGEQIEASCGGLDGLPFLVAGLALMAIGLIAYRWMTRRPGPRRAK